MWQENFIFKIKYFKTVILFIASSLKNHNYSKQSKTFKRKINPMSN